MNAREERGCDDRSGSGWTGNLPLAGKVRVHGRIRGEAVLTARALKESPADKLLDVDFVAVRPIRNARLE